MINSMNNPLLAGHLPTKDLLDIGLGSTAAMAQAALDAGEKLGVLQIDTLRSALNESTQAALQLLASGPTAVDAKAASIRAMSYWRSVAWLAATTQAQMADLMASGLSEMSRLAESSKQQDDQGDMARLPMAVYSALTASVLTSAQAACSQMGKLAGQIAANSEDGAQLASSASAAQALAARTQRKAA